jgi:peptide/nickel transport system permease protein/oligopeptide transport system permease protein
VKGWKDNLLVVLAKLMSRKGTALAVLFLLVVSLAALFADLLPLHPYDQDLVNSLIGPSPDHWFGTDELGRDILSRVIYGARTSLITAACSALIAVIVGVPVGLVAGYFGGWRDTVLMRAIDVLMSLPAILFAMALIAVLGRSQVAAFVAVGLTGIPAFARITRAQVLSLRKQDFVTAVEAFGGTATYSMFRAILPNSWSPILVQIVVLCSIAVLLEAALSFLGVGVAPPTPSWGEMLQTGKSYLHEAPYYAVLPGMALTLTILSFDAIGRSLGQLLENRRELRPASRTAET